MQRRSLFALLSRPAALAMPQVGLTLALLSPALLAQNLSPQFHQFAREDVLGTSCLLVVQADDDAAAAAVATAVFHEVERLRSVLSTWDDQSELGSLCRSGKGTVSHELGDVLQLALQWRERSHGAFEPGVAALTQLWSQAADRGEEPAAEGLQAVVAKFAAAPWSQQDTEVTVHGPITLDALAKGYIVDHAFAVGNAASSQAQVSSFQIGGDMRLGATPRRVQVVDPQQPSTNGSPLATLQLGGRAIASSGSYERGFEIGTSHHSHILDPHTGRPCDQVLGVSVVAADVATADVLATTLCVLGAKAGFALLATLPGTEAIVVTADGTQQTTPGWAAMLAPASTELLAASKPWPAEFALQIDFEIQAPAETGGRRRGGWKRPYVAVWLEDITGRPARTLCLWLEDRRWLRDLRRWSRQHAEMPQLVDLVSQATRKAGRYTLSWDGTDDEGRQLAPGRYTVCIEAVREHGSYQLIRHEIELGGDAVQVELRGNEEIAHAALRFGRPTPAASTIR